ncbi:LamG-like jellyroll fold domain-containing protein [Paraflavitalea soli]|nr:LamG-like jellyroll fold domain-containing protein [Paraflavitalea soli]
MLMVGLGLTSHAQSITNYTFAASTGTFTALSAPLTTTWSGNTDDASSALIPIGFDFWYMGVRYTNISASSNGWITLGSTISDNLYTNNLTSGGAPRPVIAPLWDDLELGAFTNVTYQTTGTTGSRVFTLQYLNTRWYYLNPGIVMSFQVKLYEATGRVQFVYRPEATAALQASASIGITAAATGSGNFLSVNNAGTSVSSTNEANVTSKPVSGRTYSFTPPVLTAPGSLTFTGISSSAMTLNWTDLSSTERGFVIYSSTDGVNYNFVTQTAPNITSSVQSGLATNTTYYWQVFALSEGALSTALSGSQTTSCAAPAAPTVTSPVNYCQNATATALTATGSNLLWSTGSSQSGTAGGTATLTTNTYVDAVYVANNKKTNFTTTVPNVTISTVSYYIPAFQTVTGLVLALFNNAGTVIATSTTTTTQTAGASAIAISNTFNYTITNAGNYSIGVLSGSGVIGSDNPSFPITEPTGTINITGVSTAGARCFNNIQFTTNAGSATAPIPSTATTGSVNYFVTQTVGGCVSAPATITVNVTAPNISQVPTTGLIANYRFNGNANDATGNNNGVLQNSPASTADRFNIAGRALQFDGSSQYISTTNSYVNPGDFTISIWFKTATTTGGKLIGFGREQTGASGQFDRHIYMNNAGQLYFGVYPNTVVTVNSTQSYNDNNWHLATATLSSTTGMALYVDGVQVGANTTTTTAENYTGYWRIGYDNVSGWISTPTSFYFNGSLDDALIYSRALSPAEVAITYNSPDGAGNNGPVCAGSTVTLSATTLPGATYSWIGPGFSSVQQNPSFTYTAAAAGTYTLQVTAGGCTATAYTNVSSSTNTGQWTGVVSTDWANGANWCTGIAPTAATNVVISASAVRMPTISSSVTCNSLTINAGATLTIAAAGILNIGGTLTNNGTVANTGTINFNGTSGQQTFSGINTFYNLTLTNANGLLLPAAITVSNNLSIAAGTLDANNFNIAINGNWTNNAAAAAFIPGTGTVTFGAATGQTIGGSFATTFNNLTLANTADTVTLTSNINIQGNLFIASGTFNLGAFTANRTTAGGILTVSNNATLRIGGTNTYPANYTTNTLVVASTVEYAGANQAVANQAYGNLKLSSSAGAAVKTFPATALTILGNLSSTIGTGTAVSFTAASNITINGNITIGASTTFNSSSFTHTIGGNWVNNGVFIGSTGTIVLTGAGKSISGSGAQNFNHLTVSASLLGLPAGSISLSGSLLTTGAGSITQAAGGTVVMSGTGATISGQGIVLENLTVSGTVSTAANLTLTGNLSVSGSFTTGAGIFTMSGTGKTITGAGTKNFGILSISGTLTTDAGFSISNSLAVTGSFTASAGAATFTGTSKLSGTANLFNVVINGTSLQLSANALLGIASGLTLTAGTLDVTTATPNTVNFNGAGAQNINGITYFNLNLSAGGNKTATGAFTVNNTITIASGVTFIPGNFTHSIYNNWNNLGSFTAGTSTIQFLGNLNSHIIGNTTFNSLTVNLDNASTSLFLDDNISASIVNMVQGVLRTGVDTLTITSDRTGNGKILGTVQRIHAFNIGTAYAFESPWNTISFTVALGVNKIVMVISEDNVNDFPFGAAVNEQITISIPNGTYVVGSLSFDYEKEKLNGNNENTMVLWQNSGSGWVQRGKTTNSTNPEYVTLIVLGSLDGRWTLSSASNVVRWNGSVSTDWNTAANWTVTSGLPSTPPSATDIVELGTVTFNFQPAISTSAVAKNIRFGSAKAVTLSMAAGGSLTTAGNIDGTWTANALHTIQVNGQTLSVGGDLNLSDGVAGQAIQLNIGTGTVNVTGALAQSVDASVTFSGAGTLNLAGNFNYLSGSFTPGSGTMVYNGTANQVIARVTYNNLTINKTTALASISDSTNILGNVSLLNGELDNNAPLNIRGNVLISAGAVMLNNARLYVGGNWTNNGSYTGAGPGIQFNGTGTQTVNASTFNNVLVNKPVGSSVLLTGNMVVKGDLTVLSGTLDIQTYDCNRQTQGGNATLAQNGTFIIGANNPPLNFANYLLDNSSTVVFNGSAAQTLQLQGINFGNLIMRNAGIKTLTSPATVNGNLTIESGASFNADTNTISLQGNWTNNGTFIPGTSTLLCSGSGKTISGLTTFNKVTVVGSYTVLNDVTFNTLLNITSTGSITGGPTLQVTMNGDLINSGVLNTLGTTIFTGNVVQTLSLINAVTTVAMTVYFNGTVSPVLNSTSVPQFGNLFINNTAGVYPSVGWTILLGLTIGNGASFNGGVSTHNILGAVTNNGTITSSGRLNFIPSSTATVNLGTNFNSTGTVVFGGTGAMTLAGAPASFRHVIIANTNAAGVTPSSNWSLAGDLIINSGALLNAGSFTHTVSGHITDNGVLNSGSSTFILNGTVNQQLYGLPAFNNLTLNKPSGVAALLSGTTVNGVLNFIHGQIVTDSNMVIQPASGTVTGAAQSTGWINGNLRKYISTGTTVKLFEVGDSLQYTPVSVAFANVTTGGYLTTATVPTDQPQINSSQINAALSVNRYWTLVNSGIAFTTYNATFNFAPTDVDPGVITASLIGGMYSNGTWIYPTVGAITATSIQLTGIADFGSFQVGMRVILVKTWDGGAGTRNWSDAANWNTDGVPTAIDDVNLNAGDTIFIDVAATTKHLILNNSSLQLTIGAGHTLQVSGDLTVTNGTLNTEAAFPTVQGNVSLPGGTIGFTGTGTQTIPAYQYYNLASSSTGTRLLPATGTIAIAGSFTPGNNAYTITGSTINYNGFGQQNIASFKYNNLTLGNTGIKYFSSDTTSVAGALTTMDAATADAVTNSSTISYNGTTGQTITPLSYYNLDVSLTGGGSITLPNIPVNHNLSVSSGSVSIGVDATPLSFAIGSNITVAAGAAFQVATTSNATHQLTIGGDVINNGTFNLRPDANSFCNVLFNKDGIQTIGGSGAVTSFNNISINQGVSFNNYLDVTAANFSAPDGFLTLNNGAFNLNSTGASVMPFTADIATGNTLIPATAGLWVNAGTIRSANMNWTVAGQVKVTGGAMNMGSVADNAVIPLSTAMFTVAAGNLNLASRISNPGAAWTFNMKEGTVAVNTQGSTVAGIAPFNMDTPGAVFDMAGGTLIIQRAGGTAGQNLGYYNLSTQGPGFAGGTLQMGNAATPAAQTMDIVSTQPLFNLAVGSANTTALLQTSNLTVKNNVVITAGTLNISNKLLKIGDSISNNGSFIASAGTIEMNGLTPQTIPAAAFTGNLVNNLTINNVMGVTLGGTLDLSGILLAATGSFNTSTFLTLTSTAVKTALIDGSGAGNVLGNVTMQRYVPSGFGYKYLGSPFQAATVNELADDLNLGASFPVLYRYDESLPSLGWITYTNTTGALHPGEGYAANLGPASAPATIDMTGVVNNGNLSFPALFNHNQPFTQGFNLVGNPYPSPIDWDLAAGWSRTNVDNAVYYFNAGTTNQYTGTYSSYINGVSSDNTAGNIIAAMQGFFVHVSNGSFPVAASMSINNNARINNLVPDFRRRPASTLPLLRLSAGFADETTITDPIVVYFDDQDASRAFDREMDALKLMNTDPLVPNLYAVATDTARLSICAWPHMRDSADKIPLGLEIKKAGWISFHTQAFERIPRGSRIYLYDAKTGINQDLQVNPLYRLYLEPGEYRNRFYLLFNRQGSVQQPDTAVGIFRAYSSAGRLVAYINAASGEKCTVAITNMQGQVLLRRQLNGNGYHELGNTLINGVYVISFYTQHGVVSQRVMISH